jgi:hypothetical protein
MSENEIQPVGSSGLMIGASSMQNVMARVQLIHTVMEKVMIKDTHYGIVPGTNKPTLLKPGAEVLATTFQLAPTVTTDIQRSEDAIRVTAHVSLHSVQSGLFLGEGVGECSTGEEKFKWRASVSDEEFNATPENLKRIAYKKGKGGSSYTVKQIRQNPDDMANTVLKMAKKRAFVDAILTVTGASDIFTQDVEDMDIPNTPKEDTSMFDAKPDVAKPDIKEPSDADIADVMPDATTKELTSKMYETAKEHGKTTGNVREMFQSLFKVEKYTELSDEQLRKMIVILEA